MRLSVMVLLSVAVSAGLGLAVEGRAEPLREGAPVATWTFNGTYRRLARDVAGNTHHATGGFETRHVDSPGGRALVFNGEGDFLRVKNHPDLVMTDSVTVDVWVWVDDPQRPGAQCVIDKGGERYRIHVAGGRVMFGLKTEGSRLDLTGGELKPKTWYRVTGVFERPNAYLYVDGEQVGQRTWDHEVGPGGDLLIGSKAGSTDFFGGQIDEVRIYRAARPPRPTDVPSREAQGAGIVEANAKLQVKDVQGGVAVDTGAMRFELRDDGVLRSLQIGDKALVAENEAPLLSASVLESKEYDGWRDYAPGKMVEATWRPADGKHAQAGKQFSAELSGRLEFGSGDAIECQVTVTTAAGSPFFGVTAQLAPEGAFEDRFLRSVALRLPLALNRRKRIVQGGDRGVQWNTRHFYQFHVSPTQKLMNEPEHNLWRLFASDQNTSGDYHLWRSESTATSSLTMQRGIKAPGWMAAYDEQAGLLFGYRGITERAPKSLRVLADGSGEALVCLWHEGLPALDVRSPQAAAVFGEPHVTDWMVFDDEFRFAQPDVALATHWGVEGLVSDPPARNEVLLEDLDLLDAPAGDDAAPPVTGGVPLPRGALTDPNNVRLRKGGADVPLQTKPVGYWPDKSIKWLLLTFPADGGEVEGASGEGEALQFALTRRTPTDRSDQSDRSHRLDYGGTAKRGRPQVSLTAVQERYGVTINTGPLELQLGAGERWLRSAKLNGAELLNGGARSFVDFLRTEGGYSVNTTHAAGTLDDGTFVPEKIELEEAGPLRATVRLEGKTTSQESPRVIVRVEAYAGRSIVRVFQSVEFLHKDPRQAFVRCMGIELPLASTGGARVTVGGQDGPVVLGDGSRAGLKQHSHLGYTAWHQRDDERFLRHDDVKHRSRGWLDLSSAQNGVAVMLRDMWQQFPNELMADKREGKLVAYFWPESGPVMDVRRYSNYPHRSVGESVPSDSNWVSENYYKNDPFLGVSKTHEMLLYFHGAEVDGAKIDSVAADFQRPPLVYCGPDWYLDSGVVLPQLRPGTKGFERAQANLDHFARFWLHHQKLWGWYGMWDYGDVQHQYKTGYGWTVPPDKLVELLEGAPEDYETIDVSKWRRWDYAPNHEWAFDNGRWGWTNTEGLPGLYIQNQYLRTGDRDLYFFAEAMARHVRDVDMRHAGKWYGRGTRHGVQHWSDGNHEERQTTHSEFRYVYALGGDMRCRDFASELYRDIYSRRDVAIHAAHSGRLQGLLTWWEMTGSDETATILEKYIPCFLVAEGVCISPSVDFPEVKCLSQTRDVNGSSMFFWTFGAGHGMLEYFRLTGNEALKEALIKVANLAMKRDDPGNFRKAVVFAALHADDPTPYREYLKEWAKRSAYLVQVVPHNPEFYGGPRGMLRGSVAGSLFVMNDLPYLLTVLEGDPELTDQQREGYDKIDREGGAFRDVPLLSWQSEYDREDLAEYLRIKHPQP